MKKLLHIGCNVGTESMPKAFRKQCDYFEIPVDKNTKKSIQELNFVPDIVFLQIQNDRIGDLYTVAELGDVLMELKRNGACIINWTGDKRNTLPRWMFDIAHNVFSTNFSNMEDVTTAKKYGIRSEFLQQGIDTDIFTSEGHIVECPEIVFLANNYGHQFPLGLERQNIVYALKSTFGAKFGVYGSGWGIAEGNVNSNQRDEAAIYRSCKIAISMSHFDSDRYFSDRLGRALCSGALVMSHRYNGIEKDFIEGTHLICFDSIDDLIQKCRMALTQDNSKIKEQGKNHARKILSYDQIVTEILNYKL